MFSIKKIDGKSMSPLMVNGDYIVINHFIYRLKINDIVVVEHPIYKTIIKRISTINNQGQLLLKGENSSSLSSEKMGWIKKQWVIGKVIYIANQYNTHNKLKKQGKLNAR